MLNIKRDINSLSRFKRNSAEFIEQMKRTGAPVILTVNGKVELILQDAESYQLMLEAIERLEAIEGVKRGLGEMNRGKGTAAKEAFAKMRKKLNVPSDE